ncbi:MAG: GH3 auxin-responsive promoter family protein [Gammaproteobacteria bacterium]|nr:GH3 auxin-responsive promoter family protein [Gammaproteobacteria bacterium]
MSPQIGDLLARTGLSVRHGRRYARRVAATKSPGETQQRVLERIVEDGAGTAFGKRHGFAAVRSLADLRQAVPVQSYEDLRDDIEAQEFTGEPRLTADRPVYYNRTSGTVAAPKNIPVTAAGLTRIQRNQQLGAYAFSRWPGLFGGKVFAVSGAAVEGHMAGGTPYGSASGLLYEKQPRLLRARYVLPAELSAIEDYEQRYLAMAVFGVAEPRVTCTAIPNSSTLVRLLDLVNQRPDDVLRMVADGRLPDGVRSEATPGRHPDRAARLQAKLDAAGRLTYADIWPDLAGVVTWTGGSCGVAIRALQPMLPADCGIIELGYVASEVHGTVNVDPHRNACLPTLDQTIFEFVPRERWETGDPTEAVGLAELEEGEDYYVIVTTADGLYRYDMNDIVRVTGWLHDTPTLAFVQKGKGVTSITGEKVHESQVLEAVCSALEEREIESTFFIALADPETATYTLYVETRGEGTSDAGFAGLVDARLASANIEYQGKRASARLAPMRVVWLAPGTGEAYRARRVSEGQRDAQFKYLHLQYAGECGFDFDAHARAG